MSQTLMMSLGGERAYRRVGMFAIDVLDAITLERVGRNVKVIAEGLAGPPVRNASGLHVWLKEDIRALRRITVEPRPLRYEPIEFSPGDIADLIDAVDAGPPPVRVVQLPPLDENVTVGITLLRGVVLNSAFDAVPPEEAAATLEWFDGDEWRSLDAAFPIRTKQGTFVAVLRLASADIPPLDENGNATVRLRVRGGASERHSSEFRLAWGKATTAASPFYWNELYL